jgi:carboxyl-terminal processing protease
MSGPAAPGPLGRRALGAALLLFLAACVGVREEAHTEPTNAMPPLATRLFTVVYEQVSDKYVDNVSLPTLMRTGLAGMHRLDPAIEIADANGMIELRKENVKLATYELPKRNDAYRLAQLSVALVEAGRANSALLRDASPEALYQTVFDGALGELDPYTRYAGQDTARESRARRDGFGGIGITIDTEGGGVRIASVIGDAPAGRAGLRVDDVIIGIDGDTTTGMAQRDVVRRLRGPIGNPVRINVRRGPTETLEVTLVRALIVEPTVTYRREGKVAHIRVSGFNHRTTDNLNDALKSALREIGPDMQGVILDLRGNLGGLLDQAVSVADLFLAEGAIVSTRGRHRSSGQVNEASRGDLGEGIPLVVLVNGMSASASEIVAAALQDNGRAVVIGSTSFGKGSVQTVIPLPNDGELILTWAKFFSPSGYPLQDLGILPTICTTGDKHTVADILDSVRGDRMTPRATMIAWRGADHADRDGLKRLRANCEPDGKEHNVDVEAAKRLLSDRALYARALQSAQMVARAP